MGRWDAKHCTPSSYRSTNNLRVSLGNGLGHGLGRMATNGAGKISWKWEEREAWSISEPCYTSDVSHGTRGSTRCVVRVAMYTTCRNNVILTILRLWLSARAPLMPRCRSMLLRDRTIGQQDEPRAFIKIIYFVFLDDKDFDCRVICPLF